MLEAEKRILLELQSIKRQIKGLKAPADKKPKSVNLNLDLTGGKTEFCQLWLTCADKKEADRIAKALLSKHLVACVRQFPVSSDFWWQDKINHSDEILLQMESANELFDKIEAEVKKLHSYDTFVLEATPVEKVSKEAEQWLKGAVQNV